MDCVLFTLLSCYKLRTPLIRGVVQCKPRMLIFLSSFLREVRPGKKRPGTFETLNVYMSLGRNRSHLQRFFVYSKNNYILPSIAYYLSVRYNLKHRDPDDDDS